MPDNVPLAELYKHLLKPEADRGRTEYANEVGRLQTVAKIVGSAADLAEHNVLWTQMLVAMLVPAPASLPDMYEADTGRQLPFATLSLGHPFVSNLGDSEEARNWNYNLFVTPKSEWAAFEKFVSSAVFYDSIRGKLWRLRWNTFDVSFGPTRGLASVSTINVDSTEGWYQLQYTNDFRSIIMKKFPVHSETRRMAKALRTGDTDLHGVKHDG